jgi:hypothetical protein
MCATNGSAEIWIVRLSNIFLLAALPPQRGFRLLLRSRPEIVEHDALSLRDHLLSSTPSLWHDHA